MNRQRITRVFIAALVAGALSVPAAFGQDDDSSRNILKQGLLGAGTGAIAASASGGKAGQGALIGAGTGVIGSALLDALTGPSQSSSSSGRTYRRSAPPPPQDEYYYADDPSQEYYVEEPAPAQSSSQNVLKQGLIGAGTGAIASSASGGNAGKGALIGAGTSVIGNALLDTLTQPAPQRRGRVYRRVPARTQPQQQYQQQYQQPQLATTQPQTTTANVIDESGTRKKIIRKFDDTGKVVSEEEIYY